MVAMSDFSTFSQMTWMKELVEQGMMNKLSGNRTYGNAVSVFLTDSFRFSLSFLEGVLVLELGAHIDSWML
jgi:hypothetical protein